MTARSRPWLRYAMLGAVVAFALAGAWLMRSGHPPPGPPTGIVVTTAVGPPPDIAPMALPDVARTVVTDKVMVGSWSRQDNRGSPTAVCDAQSAVTFDPTGRYRTSQPETDLPVMGRYSIAGQTLTTWGRVTFDRDAEPIKDRYDERLTQSLSASPPAGILIGSDRYYRCSLG